MSIIQDLYNIYDREHAKYRADRSSQASPADRDAAQSGLPSGGPARRPLARGGCCRPGIRSFTLPPGQGTSLGALQKRSLARATYSGIREFDRYKGWDTTRLIDNVYERIATLKKIEQGAQNIDLRPRLMTLFKFLMVVLGHLEGRPLVVPARTGK